MKKNLPVTQKEVKLDKDAVIISTTDLKGQITYVNRDFVRISGFELNELVGESHNIVRHPDMPPAAYTDMWAKIKRGETWHGIVKNRCKNGDHYWVDAFVTPIYDREQIVGYQSVRTWADPTAVAAAERLYGRLNRNELREMPVNHRLTDLSLTKRIGTAFVGQIALFFGGMLAINFWPEHGGTIAVVVAILVSISALVIWGLLVKTVIKPMRSINRIARAVAGGRLTEAIHIDTADEIGEMRLSMKLMQARLRTVIGQLADNSSEVATSAGDMATSAEGTLRLMSQQHNETERVANAIGTMVASVATVAERVAATADSAHSADAEANKGRDRVVATLHEIDALVGRIAASEDTVRRLQQDGKSISEILDVIRGIAEQTNLLALNAAIEAARAGDVGRGFAVVADEVRTLASRTQQATVEIGDVIRHLDNGIVETVDVMSAVRDIASSTQDHARSMGDALESIVAAVNQIRSMTEEISSATDQQNGMAVAINQNIGQIQSLAGETVARARASSEAGQQLASLAADLKRITSNFDIGGGHKSRK
jgi:aerotaxis receptor